MNEEMTQQIIATAERLASAAESAIRHHIAGALFAVCHGLASRLSLLSHERI
jgi:hypothetical protein